jgi:toxin ParE1/3/4
MEYKVTTSHRAKRNMTYIGKYIATQLHAPETAREYLDNFKSQIAELNHMPKRFALVSDERLAKMGMRSVQVKNYSIFYIVDEQTKTVTVISVMYSRRDWVNLL